MFWYMFPQFLILSVLILLFFLNFPPLRRVRERSRTCRCWLKGNWGPATSRGHMDMAKVPTASGRVITVLNHCYKLWTGLTDILQPLWISLKQTWLKTWFPAVCCRYFLIETNPLSWATCNWANHDRPAMSARIAQSIHVLCFYLHIESANALLYILQ